MESTRIEQGIALGKLMVPHRSAQRTDTLAGDFEMYAYKSGASIFLAIFDKSAGAWRQVELT